LKTRFVPADFNLRTVVGLLPSVPDFDPSPNQLLEGAFAEMGVKVEVSGGPGEI